MDKTPFLSLFRIVGKIPVLIIQYKYQLHEIAYPFSGPSGPVAYSVAHTKVTLYSTLGLMTFTSSTAVQVTLSILF